MTSALQPLEPAAEWRGVSVQYPYQPCRAVNDVDLRLWRGDRLLLLGPSGSGKTTLLATLTGLVPQVVPAQTEGEIRISGIGVSSREAAGWAADVAFLFQDADQTLCGMTVGDEIAFALENRAVPPADIEAAIGAAMIALEIPASWRNRRTATLSGGEKQLVAIAAAMAQGAEVLVADEPTANLSPEAAQRLRALIERYEGSVLVVDHRLDQLIDRVDRIAVIGRDGRLAAEGARQGFFRTHLPMLEALGVWRPVAARLDSELLRHGFELSEPPLSVDAALQELPFRDASNYPAAREAVKAFAAAQIAAAPCRRGSELIALRDATCAPLFGPAVLHGVSMAVSAGEIVAILGRNGSGKSTLAATLAGLLQLKSGRREGSAAGMCFQNPENQFTTGSVREEINAGASTDELLAIWGLQGLGDRHPFELSYGQKRRLALASLTAGGRWPCLILDEPGAGLDYSGCENLAVQIRRLACAGRAIVVVTHDVDFAFRLCHRAIVVSGGALAFDGPMDQLARDQNMLRFAGLEEPAVLPVLRWLEQNTQC